MENEKMTNGDVKQLKKIVSKFIKSYKLKDPSQTDEEWLLEQLKDEMPNLTDEEAKEMAKEALDSINEFTEYQKSINDSAKEGISKEQWFARKVSQASTGVSVIQYGEYLNDMNDALTKANTELLDTIMTKSGEINQSFNLDGFIAEQVHVNAFNARAALSKSKFYAEVRKPSIGETYQKNSVDVVIYDITSKSKVPVHKYQMKYGADAKATIKLLKDHDSVTKYSNQQIVVPAEQLEEVRKAFPSKTIVSKIGGTEKVSISSDSLTKQQVKEFQFKVQKENVYPKTTWNFFKTKELALQLGKNAGLAGVQSAAITAGFSLVEQALSDEKIDTEETVKLALTTGADTGLKTAVTGAVKVAVEKGIIRIIPAGTPVGVISNFVCITIENIKILSKVAKGDITMSEAIEQMGRNSTAMVYGLGWGAAGAKIGAVALSWIPVVGPFVGGIVGGMVGYMAGSTFGETVFKGVKKVAQGAKNVIKSTWNSIKSGANRLKEFLFG